MNNGHPFLKLRLLALLLFTSSLAHADFDSLACYGVKDRWLGEANRILNIVENSVNSPVNQYVSLANFDLGSSQFGVHGGADLGQLTAPPFTCSDPKLTLKSGMSDFGLAPHYLISARILGMSVDIVDARMEGAQGQRTVNAAAADRKKKIIFTLKVMGVDVLHKIRRGPEVQANATTPEDFIAGMGAPQPGALPS